MFRIGLAGKTKLRFSFILSTGMLWRFLLTSKQGNNAMEDILPFEPILMSSYAFDRHKIGVPTHLFSGWMNLLESLAKFGAMFTYVFWFIIFIIYIIYYILVLLNRGRRKAKSRVLPKGTGMSMLCLCEEPFRNLYDFPSMSN